ncbi:MAG: TSUP family transporter [Marinifilaceae bacterium]
MEYIIIAIISSLTALITFLSGFGLDTILMTVFAVFFPIEIAIALTAIVHLFNNLFKVALAWRNRNLKIPCLSAFIGSFFGRKVLKKITMNSVQIIVGVMIIILAILMASGLI